ncbi:MAG: WecB/TagA/CpsF family glycosyltransferase [Chloroflexi bacterium]|nr:WecB/TagA/CpsF family glycosyltransferase [Chloroflexota bacterium]
MSGAPAAETQALQALEFRVLGTRVHGVDLGQAAAWIDAWAQAGGRAHIATVNPEFVMRARQDAEFNDLLERTRLNVPDGVGVVLAGRLGGARVPGRVTGVALMHEAMRLAAVREWPVALVGGAPGVAEAAAERLVHDVPGLRPPHTYGGARGPEGDAAARDFLRDVRPRILCVGYGAPHQELWIDRNVSSDAACVAIGIGGTLDYLSGRVPRAPAALRSVGLEWAYRLWRQPSRWRRMRVLPVFAALAVREILDRKTKDAAE